MLLRCHFSLAPSRQWSLNRIHIEIIIPVLYRLIPDAMPARCKFISRIRQLWTVHIMPSHRPSDTPSTGNGLRFAAQAAIASPCLMPSVEGGQNRGGDDADLDIARNRHVHPPGRDEAQEIGSPNSILSEERGNQDQGGQGVVSGGALSGDVFVLIGMRSPWQAIAPGLAPDPRWTEALRRLLFSQPRVPNSFDADDCESRIEATGGEVDKPVQDVRFPTPTPPRSITRIRFSTETQLHGLWLVLVVTFNEIMTTLNLRAALSRLAKVDTSAVPRSSFVRCHNSPEGFIRVEECTYRSSEYSLNTLFLSPKLQIFSILIISRTMLSRGHFTTAFSRLNPSNFIHDENIIIPAHAHARSIVQQVMSPSPRPESYRGWISRNDGSSFDPEPESQTLVTNPDDPIGGLLTGWLSSYQCGVGRPRPSPPMLKEVASSTARQATLQKITELMGAIKDFQCHRFSNDDEQYI
ncbi:uncharacterized protein SCHCODRAFT_01031819 [Schizophyllum commune H4-8]|uniref:Uncharacterized protein n=1 Tax=Schizophyllum commune (strain H4-8 / FGSC 9210) TaxID=578458 RepID=D8PZ46_SCHCM|nr:uncharacterized protein SCHCODRAFT_01031819 [Schizophyllum commune H4-8]KAI5896221.1 hypothetical protein SCHCODRAFT_01031819 [Schizophyllum commune H4-8]